MASTETCDRPRQASSGPPSADDAGQAARSCDGGRARLPSIEAEGLAEKLSGLARRLAGELADRDARDVGHVLEHLSASVDHLAAAQVAAVQQADVSDATVEETGLPTEAFLRTYCDRTGGDARMLAMAADVLADMPQTFQMLIEGTLTWGSIRGIVGELSRSSRDERSWVDGQLAGDPERLRRLGPDGVVDAVGQLLAEAAPAAAEAKAKRARAARFGFAAFRLDGTGQLHAEGPIAEIAAMAAGVQAQMARHDQAGRTHDTDGKSWRTTGRRFFDALHTLLVGRTIHGDPADLPDTPGRREAPADAGPSDGMLDVVVDVRRLAWFDPADGRTWAQLLAPAVPGVLPLTGKSLARHADDVVLQVILLDGDQVVGVTAPEDRIGGTRLYVTVDIAQVAGLPDHVQGWPGRVAALCAGTVWMTPAAKKRLDGGSGDMLEVAVAGARIHTLGSETSTEYVAPALRAALLVRDGQCRMPGCSLPAIHTDAHHITKRRHGGPTLLDGLVLLCHVHHSAVDKHRSGGKPGWDIDLASDGSATFTHADTAFRKTTLPRHKRRIDPTRPPPTDKPADKNDGRRRRGPPRRGPPHRTSNPADDADLPF